jgi:hypothetical protein
MKFNTPDVVANLAAIALFVGLGVAVFKIQHFNVEEPSIADSSEVMTTQLATLIKGKLND